MNNSGYTDIECARILEVICPYCKAAPTAKCTVKIYNAGGVALQETEIFHTERVLAAQTISEKALDMTKRIQVYLDNQGIKRGSKTEH